ncbi:hypothetical protein N7481_002080 [Penicillium waksmanii]|uniref:uncharacterized protein n=1 Tax=Penicillium waksmanii TaxID=69791 RepID=UPI0025489F52|nr:uncharacterized protein N7481_002080 [Penicillium waksmanii]KAJ5995103.1 hypothetical protein N7481_002080 [Penicillium waksmanii]
MLSRFLILPLKSHADSTSQTSGWRPSYLRKRVLILFILTFAAIIAALEVIYQSSEARNGIAISTQDRHYFWTYGPTAILTIITTLWSRVEFQTKQSAPWQALHDSPQPADKSVLLDYISDMQPVVIWKALKNKHFAVASATSCSLLLQLLIIFSTSLFSLQEAQVQKSNIPINIHDTFSTKNSEIDTVGSQPYDILNGILFENVTYPLGTTENLTFQEFSAPSLPSNAIVTAPIHGLMAEFDCEDASLDIRALNYVTTNETGRVATNFDVDIFTSSCEIANISLISVDVTQTAFFQGGQCENIDGSDGYRIVLTMAQPYQINVTSIATPADHVNDTHRQTGWKKTYIGLNRTISMICKPTLSLLKLKAESNATEMSSGARIQRVGSEDANIPGITAGDIAKFIIDNSTATTGFRPVEDYIPFSYYSHIDTGFNLGLHLIGENITVPTLWQDGVLESSGKAFYRAITALLMHMGLVQRKQSATTGLAIVTENRVMMMELPLRGMEVCLALAVSLAISMAILIPGTSITTWSPNNVSSIAAITANSAAFRASLRGTGVVSHKTLQSRLVGQKYYLQSTPKGTSIETAEDGRRESKFDFNIGSEYITWKPFPEMIGRIIIFILVLSAIVVLETLLRVSQTKDGLGDASSENEYMHYLWTMIPALAMVGIRLFFGSLDFNIRCLAPYAPLTKPKGALFERSMNLSFLDSLGLNNTFRSISSRHFAVQATTLATTAAFFLTIITSGLYSVVEVPSYNEVNFTRVGGFPDPRTIAGPQRLMDESKEVDGMLTAEYILQYNFSYPRWTYEELAFAEISMSERSNRGHLNASYVDITVPALRLAPKCKIQTAADLQPKLTLPQFGPAGSHQLWFNQLIFACPGNNTNNIGNLSLSVWDEMGSEPFGYSFESQCSFESGNSNGVVGASHYTTFYLWGYLNGSSVEHVIGLSCIQYAETVNVRTRFHLPGLEIDETNPPVPDESSAKLAPNLYTPIPEWWVLNANGRYPKFDGFFQDLTSGRYAIPIENFKSEEHDEAVIGAIKHQHKIISAQQFNNYTRGTANASIAHTPILGNVTTSNRLRVVQDVTSTRILEGLLAFILALGIIGSMLLNTDQVIPKNPCSIAAVASIVADSQLLDEFLKGVWDPDDKKLNRVFAYQRFHLGWWESEKSMSDDTEKRFFTVDHRSAGVRI